MEEFLRITAEVVWQHWILWGLLITLTGALYASWGGRHWRQRQDRLAAADETVREVGRMSEQTGVPLLIRSTVDFHYQEVRRSVRSRALGWRVSGRFILLLAIEFLLWVWPILAHILGIWTPPSWRR